MKFIRRFTKTNGQPFEGLKFVERTSFLRGEGAWSPEAEVQVVVPESWSQAATDTLTQKYLRQTGIPELERESDVRQVFHRLAGCWTDWGKRRGYFTSQGDAEAFYDDVSYMLAHQICAPNSPQWFHTGLYFAYGIKGEGKGYFFHNPETGKVERADGPYVRPQPHACFIQSVADELVGDGSIMDLWHREAHLFKYGSGSGTNFSQLRSAKENLSNGNRSTGSMAFLKVGDGAAGAIKSAGTNRRPGKLACLDISHPDVVSFINWKLGEEQKSAALETGLKITQNKLNAVISACHEGASADSNLTKRCDPGQNQRLRAAIVDARQHYIPATLIKRVLDMAKSGHTTVVLDPESDRAAGRGAGQNSHLAIRIPNSFMKALHNGDTWNLTLRSDGKVISTIQAQGLWEEIIAAGWASSEPSLQFESTINEWHTCPEDGPINASNPGGEYLFLDNTAATLASLNLLKFFDDTTGQFNLDHFRHAIRVWTTVLDISVEMAQFPSPELAERTYAFRPIGLGFANIGALMMRMGHAYGSEASRDWAAAVTALLSAEGYRTSAEMAKELGAFSGYERNRSHMLRVIRNHREAALGTGKFVGLSQHPRVLREGRIPDAVINEVRLAWDQVVALGNKYGFRNAQVTAIAPTGTIGVLMDCETSGIEPQYALVKFKRSVNGGYGKTLSPSVIPALRKLGYSKLQIEDITAYAVGTGCLEGAPFINTESLRNKGFTDEVLGRINFELSQCFDITFAFNKWILGEDFCRRELGLQSEDLASVDANILKLLGFSRQEIEAANDYICGAMTLEGAPHLAEKDSDVFDCASRCGRRGSRVISATRHLEVVAAAQPFVSGAISKVLRLPHDATEQEVGRVYEQAWHRMLKVISVHRDGSKLCQTLDAKVVAALKADAEWHDGDILPLSPPTEELVKQIATSATENIIRSSRRRALPARRRGYTQKVFLDGYAIYLRTGEYDDGSLGEIFLDLNKEGTLLRSMMNSFAIAVSIGLQCGVPLDEYVGLFQGAKFSPSGPVLGHEQIPYASSIIDLVFQDLALNYLGQNKEEGVKTSPIQLDQKHFPSGATPVVSGNIRQSSVVNRSGQEGQVISMSARDLCQDESGGLLS